MTQSIAELLKAKITIALGLWMRRIGPLILSVWLAFGQDVEPDFTGTWRVIDANASHARPKSEIKQAGNTLSIRHFLESGQALDWAVFPTDGTVKKTKDGRHTITRTGHWEGKKLMLEETGPGNAPWRSSTTQEELTLSDDGTILTMSFHSKGNDSRHDYKAESERVTE